MIKMKSTGIAQILMFVGLIAIASSCLDTDECSYESFTPPYEFVLKIIDQDSNNLIHPDFFSPDSIVLFYEDDLGINTIETNFQQTIDSGYLMISYELPFTMLETGEEEYYLYLNSADTDTINIVVKQGTDGCNTWHYYDQYLYNDSIMGIDPMNIYFIGIKL